MKYYVNYNIEEDPYPLEYWKSFAKDFGAPITVEECSRIIGDIMWCSDHQCHVEKGDGGCGLYCKEYQPCNGKSGRCRFLKWSYEPNGKKRVVKP